MCKKNDDTKLTKFEGMGPLKLVISCALWQKQCAINSNAKMGVGCFAVAHSSRNIILNLNILFIIAITLIFRFIFWVSSN